jgi:DNA-binding transcriptional MerR regulator
MPYKEPVIKIVQYPIGQVAKMFGVKPGTIRHWSKEFEEIIKPVRTKKGNRIYSPQDIETFSIIYNLVKKQEMTISGAKKRIIENRDGEYKIVEIINRLEKIKSKLIEIKNSMET